MNPNVTYWTASGEIIGDAGGLIVQSESEYGAVVRLKEIKQLIEKHLALGAPGVMSLYEENGTYVGYVNIKPEKNAGAEELCP
eukprot:2968740-Heterocapsa_arctica.AAC.1